MDKWVAFEDGSQGWERVIKPPIVPMWVREYHGRTPPPPSPRR